MNCELKELKPELVEVGDIYFIASLLRRTVVPTIVDKVEEKRFGYTMVNGGGTQPFDKPFHGILLKEREGRLECFVGKETLEALEELERSEILE